MTMIVLARLGKDAELKYLQSGTAVASLALAYNYGKKADDGKRPTQWVDAALFGKQADSLTPYLSKGKLVLVHLDDVHVEQYQKKDGTQGTSLRAVVSKLEFAGSKSDEQPSASPQASTKPTQTTQPTKQGYPPMSDYDELDDEIPF